MAPGGSSPVSHRASARPVACAHLTPPVPPPLSTHPWFLGPKPKATIGESSGPLRSSFVTCRKHALRCTGVSSLVVVSVFSCSHQSIGSSLAWRRQAAKPRSETTPRAKLASAEARRRAVGSAPRRRRRECARTSTEPSEPWLSSPGASAREPGQASSSPPDQALHGGVASRGGAAT